MICDSAVNDARGLVPNELKLLCALPPKGGGSGGRGGSRVRDRRVYREHVNTSACDAYGAPSRSALGSLVASIWLNSYHGVVGDEMR